MQRTIEEFISTDGQYTTMVKIPIKKTQLHNELKKQQSVEGLSPSSKSGKSTNPNSTAMSNIDSPSGNSTLMSIVSDSTNKPNNKGHINNNHAYQQETPQQRMARRKEEQRREQEEKMRIAAREALIARNQDKQRKNYELQGHLSAIKEEQRSTGGFGSKNPGQSSHYTGGQSLSNSPTKHQQNYPNSAHQYSHYHEPSPTLPRQNDYMGGRPHSGQETMQSISNASAFSMQSQDNAYGVNKFLKKKLY